MTTPPDFVVVDVETACSRVSSICQIDIVGFRNGVEVFEYETLVDPLDDFSPFNTRIHGLTCDHIAGAPTFGDIHSAVDGHLSGRIWNLAGNILNRGDLIKQLKRDAAHAEGATDDLLFGLSADLRRPSQSRHKDLRLTVMQQRGYKDVEGRSTRSR